MLAVIVAIPQPAVAAARLDDSQGRDGAPPSPATCLAGLTLLQRTLFTLQKVGITRAIVVVGRGATDMTRHVAEDPRTQVELRTVEVDDPQAVLGALRGEVDGPFVLARCDVVTAPEIYRQLVSETSSGGLASLAAADGEPIGPFKAQAELLDALPDPLDDEASLAELRQRGRVALMDVGPHWWASARSAQGRRQATWHLFEACRKPVDGFISRHLNRHISLFISKRVVGTPLSPNGATIVTFLVGVAAAAFALGGGYLETLIAAALFQLNQILDGVDGELARVRHQQSKPGEWLATIGDDAALALFYGALAIGARSHAYGQLLSTAGWIAAATTVLAAVLYYTELYRVGSGDLYAIEWDFDKRPAVRWRDKAVMFFRTIFKQDFFSFVFLCAAALGVLHQVLPMFAAGGVIIVTAATIRRIRQPSQA